MRVLVINLGWEQARLLSLLKARPHQFYGVHYNEDVCPDLPLQDLLVTDLRDLPSILDFAEKVQPDAVISDQCDYSLFACAAVSVRFGIPGPSLGAAQTATNKYVMRQKAAAAGLPQPAFKLCISEAEARSAAEEIGYPVIVKPIDNRGSFGVNRVDAPNELADAVLDAVINASSRLFLVEEFISGQQIIVEGLVNAEGTHQSLALGWKTMRRIGSRQIADDILFCPKTSPRYDPLIMAHNDRVAKALGYESGLTSGEYRIDADGRPVLLEMANRGGGVCIASVAARLVSGIDSTEDLVRFCLGEDRSHLPQTGQPPQSVKLHYLLYPPGKYTKVTGLKEAETSMGISFLRWYPTRANGEIKPPRNDAERQGLIISAAETDDQAEAYAQAAAEQIEVSYL